MKCERCGARGEVRKIGLYARLPGPLPNDQEVFDAVLQDIEAGAVCEICTIDIMTRWAGQLTDIAIDPGWSAPRGEVN